LVDPTLVFGEDVLALGVWAAFIADPSMMSPGSLNRDSPTAEKVADIGFGALLVAFGVAWLFLVRYLRRRINGQSG